MNAILASPANLDAFLKENMAAAVYFSGEQCGVCHALEPKLVALFERDFPRLAVAKVRVDRTPALAAQQQVLTVPTLLIYFEGKETIRKSRSFSLLELGQELQRPYRLLVEQA